MADGRCQCRTRKTDAGKGQRWGLRLTHFEEIDPRFVAPDVKILLQQPAAFEPELRHVVAPVVAQEDEAAGFEDLLWDITSAASKCSREEVR